MYINGVEGFWSFAKERLAKHHGVSPGNFLYCIKELYRFVEEETDSFTNITEEMLKERPQLLYVFRMILCLSQSELSKLLKANKQWVKH